MNDPITFLPAPSDAFDAPANLEDAECPCDNPDDQYVLEIDAGNVLLHHRACGRPPRGDYLDLVELPRTPVTLKAVPYGNCDGREWHGEHRCDCGSALVATVNDRAVLHDNRAYLIGRIYKDSDWDYWRITGDVDAQGQPLIHLVTRDGVSNGGPVPIGRVADFWNLLTLQPLTPKES